MRQNNQSLHYGYEYLLPSSLFFPTLFGCFIIGVPKTVWGRGAFFSQSFCMCVPTGVMYVMYM